MRLWSVELESGFGRVELWLHDGRMQLLFVKNDRACETCGTLIKAEDRNCWITEKDAQRIGANLSRRIGDKSFLTF